MLCLCAPAAVSWCPACYSIQCTRAAACGRMYKLDPVALTSATQRMAARPVAASNHPVGALRVGVPFVAIACLGLRRAPSVFLAYAPAGNSLASKELHKSCSAAALQRGLVQCSTVLRARTARARQWREPQQLTPVVPAKIRVGRTFLVAHAIDAKQVRTHRCRSPVHLGSAQQLCQWHVQATAPGSELAWQAGGRRCAC